MPIYHLHVRRDGRLVEDEEGQAFPDLAAAQIESEAVARDLILAAIEAGQNDVQLEIVITDGQTGCETVMPYAAQLSGFDDEPGAVASPAWPWRPFFG